MNTRTRQLGLALSLLMSSAVFGCSNAHGGAAREDGAAASSLDASATDTGVHDAAAQDAAAQDAGAAAYARACNMNDATPESGSCRTDRRLLECKVPGGSILDCLLQSCAEADGFRADRCRDLCAPDELAASCGGIGPNGASNAPPDPACHDALATPGGVVFYCCPCAAD
jgi:hypothetical protein